MSGIVGLWNFDGAPVQRDLLQRLSAALDHRGPDTKGFWAEGPVGLAACLLRVAPESLSEVQPAVRPGEAVVVFDGRLDNREEILAAAQASDEITAASPDSALVLAAYRQHGEEFVERLNGDFALALFDIRKRTLFLARDFLGVRPLYYARLGETFLFASEIKAILAYPGFPRVPNENALAVFLAQGISQDEKGETLFSGVFDCPPAHSLTVTPQKTVPSRHWSFDGVRPQPLKTPGDCSEGFRWHFEQAVRRRVRSAFPVAVSVSGGLDSSSVFCVAEMIRRNCPRTGAPIVGVSLMYPLASPADERQFLMEIERMYGLTIMKIPAEAERNGSSFPTREGIWHEEIPPMDAQWNESYHLYEKVAALGARVMLTGHWGDLVLCEHSHFVDLFNNFRFAELRARLRCFPLWMQDAPPGFVRQQFLQDLLRDQKKRLPQFVIRSLRMLRGRHQLPMAYSDSLRRIARSAEWQKSQAASSLATFHAQSLCARLQSPYFLSSSEGDNKVASRHGMEIAFPLADRDVIGFVMGVPPELYSAGAVPKGMLRQALRGVVPDGILDRRGKADFSSYVNASMSAQYAEMVSFLQGAGMILKRGYVDRGRFWLELERWFAQTRMQGSNNEAAWNLQKICRLELWLQVFFIEEQ